MSSPSTPQRVTRSMSTQPPTISTTSTTTAPGPPVPDRGVSTKPGTALDVTHPSNPFQVDIVIPYDVAVKKGTANQAQDQKEVREGYEELLRALEGEGGLRVAGREGRKTTKGKSTANGEVWVFVGISDEKVNELVEKEKDLDRLHGLPPHAAESIPSPSTRLRLLHQLLTAPALQHGLGITPGQGKWKRVKSIAALHDEEADKAWLDRWTKGDWMVGIASGLGDNAESSLGAHQPPPVHLYFEFLSTYSLSLVPLAGVSVLYYLLTPADSYPPSYALVLCLYSTIFVAYWRIRERKLAIKFGTKGCESVAVSRLRPEYVVNLGLDQSGLSRDVTRSAGERTEASIDVIRQGDDLKRDIKIAASVPVIIACGVGLGCVLMGIFILEAFVGQVYEGVGHQVVPLAPTALFVLVVPQIVGLYQTLAKRLVKWEDHPTPVGAEKSLTGKTFAMNGIVAYLGLFLTAYVYVPFGPFIMSYVQQRLVKYEGQNVKIATSAEKTGLGPRTSGAKQHQLKAGRLKNQLFAYTVTNQVVGSFLEIGMPYIMRFIDQWRAGNTTVKETWEKRHDDNSSPPVTSDSQAEARFLEKVERELAMPEYSLFTDYAEMCTQFGYITVWSIVWPPAPVFALLNNYFELRSDALKICKHVRRPLGDRVESIGPWLETLSIISWIGAVTQATLIFLFHPSRLIAQNGQSPNPNVSLTLGSTQIAAILASYDLHPILQSVLPTVLPLVAVAFAASHGWIVLKWIVDGVMERVFWRGSQEEMSIQRMKAGEQSQTLGNGKNVGRESKPRSYGELRGGFWNGGEEGAKVIGKATKGE